MTLKIVHKRSNETKAGEAKAPLPTDLEQGEIAINYSEEDPALFIKDEADNVVRFSGTGGSSVAEDVIGGDGIIVTPDASNEKVTVSADLDTGKGLEINSEKIAAKIDTAKGLDFDTGNIAVKTGAAISFDGSGQIQADVDTEKGIEITDDKIAAKLDAFKGLEFDSGNIAANIDIAKGLEFNSGAIATNIGNGLSYDGDGKIVANVGGGITIDGGEITADVAGITGGNGITATKDANNDVTIEADINTNKGLEFDGDQIATKLGVGLAFNGSTGAIDSQAQALIYRGVVDLTANGAIPGDPTGGDTYANTEDGTLSDDWQTATQESAGTAVVAGDLVVWNGTKWTHIPTGGHAGAPNFWQLASKNLSPVENTYNLDIGGGDITLNADGSGSFSGKVTSASTVSGDSGDTLVTKDFLLSQIPSVPTVNDGALTIKNNDGSTAGTFTANQAAATNITLPKEFSGSYSDLTGKPTIGNGSIEINGGAGITATGDNAKANQTGTTTRTLKVDTSWLGTWLGTNYPHPSVPTVNDGKLTIKNNDGSTAGSFTANQSTNTNITLPKGFSGSYNDLTDKPSATTVYWQRSGTTLSPVNAGDKATSASTEDTDPDETLVTKDYLESMISDPSKTQIRTRAGTSSDCQQGFASGNSPGTVICETPYLDIGFNTLVVLSHCALQPGDNGAQFQIRISLYEEGTGWIACDFVQFHARKRDGGFDEVPVSIQGGYKVDPTKRYKVALSGAKNAGTGTATPVNSASIRMLGAY